MPLPELPKNPKVADLIPLLAAVDERVAAIEAYVERNDARISALEMYAAQVIAERGAQIDELHAGAVQRQQEVNELRWALARGQRATRR